MCYKNPFRDYKAHPENRPTLRRPGLNEGGVLGKLGNVENWGGETYRTISSGHSGGVESLTTGDANQVATTWKRFSQNVTAMQTNLNAALRQIPEWEGESGRAAKEAIGALSDSLRSLGSSSLQMGNVVGHLADSMDQVKGTLPESYESFAKGLDDAGADEGERKQAEEAMDKVAREAMNGIYTPALRETAIGAPSFGPPTISPGTSTAPGSRSGPGSTGSGGNKSGPGAPNGGNKTPPPAKKTPTPNKNPGNPSNLGNALNNAAQQMTGAGKDAAQKAGDAANKAVQAALQKNQAKTNDKKRTVNPLTKGKGTPGAKGGGKGGGGKSGGAGAGGKMAGDLAKGSLRNALRLADGVERALLGNAARGAGPMGGPMGGGGAGAGARGAGEERGHKAAKYLQTTENGELLLGTPVEGYRSILATVSDMVNAEPYQGLPIDPDDVVEGDDMDAKPDEAKKPKREPNRLK